MLRFWKRGQRYNDLAVSIEEHIEERTEELIEEGLPREEAGRRARREFGSVTQVTERSREAWQWRGVEQLLADCKLTLRRLAKAPGFTVTVLLTLAIGIGANTAVFSVINSVVVRPLPYPSPTGWWRCGWRLRGRRGWQASEAGCRCRHRWI